MDTLVIGAGGIGAWLCNLLHREGHHLTIMDGDTVEQRNLDRQWFIPRDVGKAKATVLASRYGGVSIPSYLNPGKVLTTTHDLIMCCPDNNPARVAALDLADRTGVPCILGGNGEYTSEAYYYDPMWRGDPDKDPRLYTLHLLEDKAGDPLNPCTGPTAGGQLAFANMMAASMMMWMFHHWHTHKRNKIIRIESTTRTLLTQTYE